VDLRTHTLVNITIILSHNPQESLAPLSAGVLLVVFFFFIILISRREGGLYDAVEWSGGERREGREEGGMG